MTRWPIGRLTVVALAMAAGAVSVAVGQEGNKQPAKVLVRPAYKEGRLLRYRLKLSGATVWTPDARELEWGKRNTDFTFVLRGKTLRQTGACTFELLGQSLRSAAEGPKGKVEVEASPEKAKIKANGKWATSRTHNPLHKEMTVTFGPRGAYRFGTGLWRIAVYLLPHVDVRFWTLLTSAPENEVGPGDSWHEEFQLPVPGAKGKPLHLTGSWKVLGWQTYRGQKVLAMALAAELDLRDSDLLLNNGDRVRVHTGVYLAKGKALWDVKHGALCSATAEQKILVKASGSKPRALRSEHKCSLQLLAGK